MRNESQKDPVSQESKNLEKISIDEKHEPHNINNENSDEDHEDDSEEDEYASEQEKSDNADQDPFRLKRATRTRRFKDFNDRSEGPPLKTMVLKNDELSQYGERSKSKHMNRQPNT